MKRQIRSSVAIALVSIGTLGVGRSALAQATVVSLPASEDTTLYAENVALSNGRGPTMFAGSTASGAIRRLLIRFDVTGAIPAHAKIQSAKIRLRMTKTNAGATAQSLFAVTAPWGEETSNAGDPGGGGTPATAGDATWRFSSFNTTSWASLGGDFLAAASASTTVTAIGDYSWSSARLAADVQSWIDAGSNNGWELIGNESALFTSKQCASRESLTPAARPALEVAYLCGTDFDRDGFTTGDDFDAFVAAFEFGGLGSDFDGDGFVTGDDFDAYVVSFELGC